MLKNLIKWQDQNGYKSKYVANKLDLTESEYSQLRHGKKKVTVKLMVKFQKEFNYYDGDIIELFRESEE